MWRSSDYGSGDGNGEGASGWIAAWNRDHAGAPQDIRLDRIPGRAWTTVTGVAGQLGCDPTRFLPYPRASSAAVHPVSSSSYRVMIACTWCHVCGSDALVAWWSLFWQTASRRGRSPARRLSTLRKLDSRSTHVLSSSPKQEGASLRLWCTLTRLAVVYGESGIGVVEDYTPDSHDSEVTEGSSACKNGRFGRSLGLTQHCQHGIVECSNLLVIISSLVLVSVYDSASKIPSTASSGLAA